MPDAITVIRIIGGICVVAAGVLWGEMKARGLQFRLRQLQQLQQAMRLLSTEVSYTATPLPYAFSRIGNRLGGMVGELFLQTSREMIGSSDLGAREAWVKTLRDFQPFTRFTGEDCKVMEQLGTSLGLTDREGQVKQIQLVSSELEYALEEARRERDRHEKMWRYLGVLGGFGLVVFLM